MYWTYKLFRPFTFQKSPWGMPSGPHSFSTCFACWLCLHTMVPAKYQLHISKKYQEIHLKIRINISSTVYIYYHISCRNTTLIIFTCTPPTTMLPAVMSLNHYHLEVMWSFSLTCLSSTTNIKLYSSPLSSYWATWSATRPNAFQLSLIKQSHIHKSCMYNNLHFIKSS